MADERARTTRSIPAIILAVIFNARGERKQGRIILKKAEAA